MAKELGIRLIGRAEGMNRCVLALLVLVGIAGTVALIGCCCDDAEDDLAPLVVDTDAPLLLDEPSESDSASGRSATKAEAENPACFVCHANYSEERLVVRHAAANVGCIKCHGTSYPHRNDENHTTAPGHMYAAETVAPLCKKCHDGHKIEPEKLEAVRKERSDKPASDPVVCTDCHGKHRLPRRSVRWDKTTGSLISTGRAN